MRFLIKGYEKHLGKKYAEVYVIVSDRAECCRYLNKLKNGHLSDTVVFYMEEEHEWKR